MYNLDADEIMMVDGGGEGFGYPTAASYSPYGGNSYSGYPASPGSNSGPTTAGGAALAGAVAASLGAFAGCMAATGGLGAIGCVAGAIGAGAAVAGAGAANSSSGR